MYMIRLEASTMFFHPYAVSEIFSAMNTAGLDSVEFWMETPDFWFSGMHIDDILEQKKKYPAMFPIAMHAPIFDLNPCSINPDVARLAADYTCACIEMLDILGGGIVTIHPGKRTVKRPVSPEDAVRFHTYLNRVSETGSSRVKIALENMPPAVNAHMTTAAEMRGVLDEYAWLGFTWDYAHAQLAGDPFSFPALCADRMINIHASLGRPGAMHSPLAGTDEGYQLIQALKDISYDSRVTFELEDMSFSCPSYADRVDVLQREQEFFANLRCI